MAHALLVAAPVQARGLAAGMARDAGVGLAQRHALLARQRREPLHGAQHQVAVGGIGDGLGLHGGVDGHALHRPGLHGAAVARDGEGVGEQGLQPLGADAVAPSGHGAAVERQPVLKEPLATEGLEVWVLHPGGADGLVGQRLHMLEDVQPRHQPGGQARPADLVDEGRATGRIQLLPVDAPTQLRQSVPWVEDRLEGLAEHVGLHGGITFGGAHRFVSIRLKASESDPDPAGNPSRAGPRGFASFWPDPTRNLAKANTLIRRKTMQNQCVRR